MPQQSCIYCGGTDFSDRITHGLCLNCHSLVSFEPEQAYKSDYHAYRTSLFSLKPIFLGIKAKHCGLDRGLVVADIGCGSGHALKHVKRLGGTTIGCDIPAARKSVLYCDWFFDDLSAASRCFQNCCDVVWCWHTIEHTNRPSEMIFSAARLLKPGGRLYLEFPESELLLAQRPITYESSCYFPEHRGVPSARSMVNLCEKSGLKIIKQECPTEGRWLYLSFGPVFHKRIVAQKQPRGF